MRIPTWRLVLTGGAVVILATAGIGLVAAANAPSAPPSGVAGTAPTSAPGSAAPERVRARDRLGERPAWGARLLRLGRHMVHVEATVTDRDGALITLWIDHGTVQSIGSGSLTVAEAGGTTQTLKTDGATIVHLGREDGTLADVTAGAEVFVRSRVDGGSALAKRILVIPARSS